MKVRVALRKDETVNPSAEGKERFHDPMSPMNERWNFCWQALREPKFTWNLSIALNKNGCCEARRGESHTNLQTSTNLNSSPFFDRVSSTTHYARAAHRATLAIQSGKRARVNRRKKVLIVLLILRRKKGCGSSNKHSVWICLLDSDDIQWQFNRILLLLKLSLSQCLLRRGFQLIRKGFFSSEILIERKRLTRSFPPKSEGKLSLEMENV